ncbi:EKC/KEOPS complex subunit GON7 [Cladorrhinum sp. PSN332]|nr:EKC/KEOPS complex subunit GON7 [Cladorrhinum sp. PSN332]
MSSSSTFSVAYTSTTNAPFSISETLTPPFDTSIASKQTYLDSLRRSIISAQERVNKELTDRMEEDNKRSNNNKSSIDDAKEEENYGEEVVEEDE